MGRIAVLAVPIGVLFLAASMDQELCADAAGAVAAGGAHHVVGGDPGWHLASDIPSWSTNRRFRVGDTLWFAYSPADGGVAEVGGAAEFELCDVCNPIRMYNEGLNRIGLGEEGSRYFVSADRTKCKDGLKLHVEVRPPAYGRSSEVDGKAVAPAPVPARSSGLQAVAPLTCVLLALVYILCL